MRKLDANINRAAGFSAARVSALSTFGFIAVAARLLATLGARRGIDRPLNDRRCRLCLNLWNRLGGILREYRGRQHRCLERRYIHNFPRLTSTTITRFLHRQNEKRVNDEWVNSFLNKTIQTTLFAGFLEFGAWS
jgi:hypothetical protein